LKIRGITILGRVVVLTIIFFPPNLQKVYPYKKGKSNKKYISCKTNSGPSIFPKKMNLRKKKIQSFFKESYLVLNIKHVFLKIRRN